MANIYNVGIAFIYTFCKKDNLKFQFTANSILTMIFNKLAGNVGSFLYNLFNQSFFKVNLVVAISHFVVGLGFIFLYKDV
jgi:hypothetical protein